MENFTPLYNLNSLENLPAGNKQPKNDSKTSQQFCCFGINKKPITKKCPHYSKNSGQKKMSVD